jgi:Fe-S cluster biogenesis protein NfuA
MDRFITVNKEDDVAWEDLLKRLAEPIQVGAGGDSGASGEDRPVQSPETAPGYVPGADPILDRINQVLDEKVRPGLAGDGGGLEIVGYHDHRLMIHYQGACGSCPSSVSGTLYAIENMLREEVDPEIEVVSV